MTDLNDNIARLTPGLTPITCMLGHPGYPVRSNVIEVNGRYRRIKKWIGGRPGKIDYSEETQ